MRWLGRFLCLIGLHHWQLDQDFAIFHRNQWTCARCGITEIETREF